MAEWAKEAVCLLLSVEMDMRAGEEQPRFAVRSAKPLDGLVTTARLKMQMDVARPEAMHELASLLAPLQGGKSELVVKVTIGSGDDRYIILGRGFQLDTIIANKVKDIEGIGNVRLGPLATPHLSIVH